MRPIVGLDTKTRAMHYLASDGVYMLYNSFTSSQDDHDLARAELFESAREVFSELNPAHVFCEAPLALQNGKTTRLLCMAAAAVWCGFVASEVNGLWYWVDPATWKKDVLGGAPPRGMKHKPWIRQRVLEMWPERIGTAALLAAFDREPDYFDAWCLLQYGRSVVHS